MSPHRAQSKPPRPDEPCSAEELVTRDGEGVRLEVLQAESAPGLRVLDSVSRNPLTPPVIRP